MPDSTQGIQVTVTTASLSHCGKGPEQAYQWHALHNMMRYDSFEVSVNRLGHQNMNLQTFLIFFFNSKLEKVEEHHSTMGPCFLKLDLSFFPLSCH
jgi:hypothetical protein